MPTIQLARIAAGEPLVMDGRHAGEDDRQRQVVHVELPLGLGGVGQVQMGIGQGGQHDMVRSQHQMARRRSCQRRHVRRDARRR